jgi:hypothetical protein
MSERPVESDKKASSGNLELKEGGHELKEGRRPILRKLGRFAAITPPAIALLLAAQTKPASAVISGVL